MTLEEMIQFGKSNPQETPEFYYWVNTVQEYLKAIPNHLYITQATPALIACAHHGENSIKRNSAVSQITAILMRIYDNQQESFLQEQTTAPLLSAFKNHIMQPVQTEFELAIQCKNEGRYQHAIIEACKAVESMCKIVCDLHHVQYDPKDTFSKLVQYLRQIGIVPLDGLLDGYPIMRNKTSAHGATTQTYLPTLDDATFEINRAAALIVYLYQNGVHK